MGTTAKGVRYPEVTDRVADGATAIRNLATDVDARLAATTTVVTDPAQITLATGGGWTVTTFRATRVFLGATAGAAIVSVQAHFTRATGATTLTGDAGGNLSPDVDLGTLPTLFWPTIEIGIPIQNQAGGPAFGRIGGVGNAAASQGMITLQELSASATIPAGRLIRAQASYVQTGVTS